MSEEKQAVHLLTLDNGWHQVFNPIKTSKMKSLEKEIKKLMIEQSAAIENLKAYKVVKKELMDQIMAGMSDAMNQPKLRKKLEKAKSHIEEVNQKVNQLEIRLGQLPKLINDSNKELMDESMALFYKRIKSQKSTLSQLEQEIEGLRSQITDKIMLKNQEQEAYDALNKYVIDLVGPENMDRYDQKYLEE